MARVKHYKVYEGQVNSIPLKDGQIIYTIDTGKIFLDISDTSRIQVSNLYKITSAEKSSITPITNGIYFFTDTKAFEFYAGTDIGWVPFGSGSSGTSGNDGLGQSIAETYIKDIKVTDTGKLSLVLGNDMESVTDIEIIGIDATLTTEGKAADAKAVGDALAGKLDTVLPSNFYGMLLGVDATTGQIIPVSRVPVLTSDGVLSFGETAVVSPTGVLSTDGVLF